MEKIILGDTYIKVYHELLLRQANKIYLKGKYSIFLHMQNNIGVRQSYQNKRDQESNSTDFRLEYKHQRNKTVSKVLHETLISTAYNFRPNIYAKNIIFKDSNRYGHT